MPGSRLPAYCTAVGKLLLAYMPEQPRREFINELRLSKLTSKTITRRKELVADLKNVRKTGLAVTEEEFAPGTCAIAAPVRSSTGEVVAAVNVAAQDWVASPEYLVDTLAPHLVSATDRISARLGYRRDDELARYE
jgi:IclR family transcriptional regulator, pca regulon regulatory protein